MHELQHAVRELQGQLSPKMPDDPPLSATATMKRPLPTGRADFGAGAPSVVVAAPHSSRPSAGENHRLSSFKRQEARALKLEASIWDAALLFGVEGQGCACTAFVIMLLLLNVAIQSAMTSIVVLELTDQTYTADTAARYRAWRTNTAHDVQYMDQVSGVSLAAQVCVHA